MKLPFFQFYPSDYKRDTCALSLATKGGWIDILCMLHGAQNRGTMTLPVVGWARVMGATVDQATAVIDELAAMNVAEVVRGGNGVQVTCEMEIDLFHGEHLRTTTPCSTALDAKDRPHRWFPHHAGCALTDAVEGLRQTDGRHRFSFTKRCGIDRGHEHKRALRSVHTLGNARPRQFCNVGAVSMKAVGWNGEFPSDVTDVFQGGTTRDVEVGNHAREGSTEGLSTRRLGQRAALPSEGSSKNVKRRRSCCRGIPAGRFQPSLPRREPGGGS